jgi:basic membrane protein A
LESIERIIFMRKVGTLSLFISLMVIFGVVLTACGGSSANTGGTSSTSAVKTVTLVTDIGGLNDQSFNQSADTGYIEAMKEFKFPSKVIETASESDYVSNLTRAAQTSDMVIGVGFLMASAMDTVAKEYPTKDFALIDACPPSPTNSNDCDPLKNVAPLTFKEEQAGCLAGVVAGELETLGKSKVPGLLGHNTIGAVGGVSIPSVNRYIAGYQYCSKKVDPTITMKLNYSQTFDGTAKCEDAADSQIDESKADIIFQVAGGCGLGVLQAAKAKGVYSVGVDSDQSGVNNSVVTSAIKRVDQAVDLTIKSFEAGKFSSDPPVFSLANNGVGVGKLSSVVPSAIVTPLLNQYIQDMKSGKLVVPENIQQ